MSRSYKKTPMMGIAICDSEKFYKQKAHRRLRKLVKHKMAQGHEVLPRYREISNIWWWGKDGKSRFDPADNGGKWMRK